MSDESDSVVLRPAYAWDCPGCGARDNFATAVEAELTDAEKRSLEKLMGDDAGEQWKGEQANHHFELHGGLVTSPQQVTCPKCGNAFPVFIDPESKMPDGFDPHRDLNK